MMITVRAVQVAVVQVVEVAVVNDRDVAATWSVDVVVATLVNVVLIAHDGKVGQPAARRHHPRMGITRRCSEAGRVAHAKALR